MTNDRMKKARFSEPRRLQFPHLFRDSDLSFVVDSGFWFRHSDFPPNGRAYPSAPPSSRVWKSHMPVLRAKVA